MFKSIYSTLCYSDIFDYPLSEKELYNYLIYPKKVTKKDFQNHLQELLKRNLLESYKIEQGRGDKNFFWYALPGRKPIFHQRLKRKKNSEQKKKKTRKWVGETLKIIPTIKAVYHTGALAMDNAKSKDDVDLMIITAKNTLWTTRVLTTFILDLFNKRRKPETNGQGSHNNKLCLNLYLEENSLKMPKNRRNLFTAHEIVQAKLVWDRDRTHQKFMSQNDWVVKFLPHSPLPQRQSKPVDSKSGSMLSQFSNLINHQMYQIQKIIMKSKKTSETVTTNTAFFHPRNTASIILEEHRLRQQKYFPLIRKLS